MIRNMLKLNTYNTGDELKNMEEKVLSDIINPSTSVRNLGAIFDQHLNMKSQVAETSKK